MFMNVQRLINEIVPDEPDPAAANALQEGLGGQFGEMRTMMQYLFQSFNFRGAAAKPYRDLLYGVGTEEISHVELIATTIARLTDGSPRYKGSAKKPLDEPGKGGATPLSEALSMGNIHHYLVGAQGALPVDAAGNPVAPDVTGEIEVRGPSVTPGYLDDPEATAQSRNAGWLRTGDIGTVDDRGFFQITDRSKDVIKSGGEWISSVELENLLAGSPDVLEAAVIGIPDDKWTERPLACVVLRQDKTPEELAHFLDDKVASWQIPENWAFVDEVPKTSVGKFDKKVLRRQLEEGRLAHLEPAQPANGLKEKKYQLRLLLLHRDAKLNYSS